MGCVRAPPSPAFLVVGAWTGYGRAAMPRALVSSFVSSFVSVVFLAGAGSLAVSGCSDKAADKPAATTKDAGKTASKTETEPASSPETGAGAEGWDWRLPKGLSEPPKIPADNPMSAEKVALGHQLFMDKRLSGDGSRSCYSCHQNQLGNADGRALALGAGDKPLTRNTPTIWNVGYYETGLYWDGRAATLEAQAIGALEGGNMGVGSGKMPAKAKEIAALPEYAEQFTKVFGLEPGAEVTQEHVVMALSAYERTLLCGDTAHDKGVLSESAQRGWDLFRGKASCTTCHSGDNFSDGAFHDIGLAYDDNGALKPDADVGRGKPSGDPADNYKFRTPTLRNVTQTGPYFHDGSVASLEEAVRYMAAGGNAKAPTLDKNLRNTQLSDAEIADVVEFLRALECPGELEVIGDQAVPGITEAD
jgi:cytochrome c peroxidase